ncbi:trypsin-like serine protease [Archangium violaceum]|uniref:FG-GAP-like repeat-containing protein n=1 Tax=Archangium violaceum TaxID=83451 RepID=UPI002B29D0FA|nr:trypsin-like serine protease [Archangium gephyra]
MKMLRLPLLVVCTLSLAACGGSDSSPDAAPVETETAGTSGELRNGTIVTPWGPYAAPAETRAIMQIGGCTGTLVDPRWVLSATHCGFSQGTVVTNLRPTGSVSRTVDRVIAHPTIDAVMLHLSAPMPADVPAVGFYSGSTAALLGKNVQCYGYGAKAVSNTCNTNTDCGAGQWCQGGWCLTGSSELRTGALATVANSTRGYFDTLKNSSDQSILPGDSGGPCFLQGMLAGVNSAWYFDLHGGIQVSVTDVRNWIRRTISPSVKADYTGDLRTDTAFWRPSTGLWYIWASNSDTAWWQGWGQNGDVPVLGDFDGNGQSDVTVWRPSDGYWHGWLTTVNTTFSQQWGQVGDVPVPADYDGDGTTDMAVWRPSNGTWYVIRSVDSSIWSRAWGLAGDKPVPADYDGDGRTDVAVWRPSDGKWYIWNSSNDAQYWKGWGQSGDVAAPGDYDGDRISDVAFFRPSTATWHVWLTATGTSYSRTWGQNGDIPVVGDYNGDGKSDVAVWRPSQGLWYILETDGSGYWRGWGQSGDIPLHRQLP